MVRTLESSSDRFPRHPRDIAAIKLHPLTNDAHCRVK